MKKVLLSIVIAGLFFTSCGDSKKEESKKADETKTEEVKSDSGAVDQVTLGEKLFTEKTCISCHQVDTKVVGPAIKNIIKIYDEKNADIVQFLKGNSKPIVDTDPGQVAIMKANLDGFVHDLTENELQALAAYMHSKK